MKKNPGFTLQYLEGTPFLLPFGQSVAEQRRGVRLDEAGVFLWHALDRADSCDELLRLYRDYQRPLPEEEDALRQGLDSFLTMLRAYRILPEDRPLRRAAGRCYRIAGLRLRLTDWPEFIPAELDAFTSDDTGPVDLSVEITPTEAPVGRPAELVLRSEDLQLWKADGYWLLDFPRYRALDCVELSEDGRFSRFHIRPVFSPKSGELLPEELFHALRHCFLYLAQRRGLFALHAASVLYRGRAWLFSAPSGMGKSTHAKLWQEQFGVPQLNGDLALLAPDGQGGFTMCGFPWCGTSGIWTREDVPLGGVILLRRGAENRIEEPEAAFRQLFVANRLISPAWTEEMLESNLRFSGSVCKAAPVLRLYCKPDSEAAAVCRAAVDRTMEVR